MVRVVLLASFASVVSAAHWAVLAAGSKTFSNYRHQADLCHGYQLLIEKGFDPDHIITMSYDDVANDPKNPFPGKLFNKPTSGPGKDVYAGCKIDYRGSECSANTFLNVLTGKGSGKVLKSTSEDHVFVSFYDHGGVGIIAFPGGSLHAKDMQDAFKEMHSKGMYEKLTFYLEACESGSMFQGMDIPGVYAVSAASPSESSYGCYCGSQAKVDGKSIGSCLGDLFSVNWMEDSDAKDITSETLSTQFSIVKSKTSQSHVMQWSDTVFTSDMVSDFQGDTDGPAPTPTPAPTPSPAICHAISAVVDDDWCVSNCAAGFCPADLCSCDASSAGSAWSVRQLELRQAYDRYVEAESPASRLEAGAEFSATLQDQLNAEKAFEKFLTIVYPGDDVKQAAARNNAELPENRECEMAARENFITYGPFDASSGFSMQFHKYIVNVCADKSHNIDVIEAAKQACLSDALV